MKIDSVEAAYIQHRIAVSMRMARAAASDCARMAHQGLVDRYRLRLTALKRAAGLGSLVAAEEALAPLAAVAA